MAVWATTGGDVAKAAQRSATKASDFGIGRGFEVATVPAVFGLIGFVLDALLSTRPWFTATFVLFGFIGMAVKLWLGYDAEMNREQARMAWKPGPREPAEGASSR